MWLHTCSKLKQETPAQGFVQHLQLPVRYWTPTPRQTGEWLRAGYTAQLAAYSRDLLETKTRACAGGTVEEILDLEPSILRES